MKDRIPFTYRLSWTKLGLHYYGCKFSKGCDPSDLWTKYFTSSKFVKELIKNEGDPDVIKVTRVFNTPDEALKWEEKFLKRTNANKNPKLLNRSKGFGDLHNYKDGFSTIEIQNKVTETLIKKYNGRGSASPIIKAKVEETNIKKYNATHTLNNDIVREAREKANIEKYGCINPFASPLFYENRINPMHTQKAINNLKASLAKVDYNKRQEKTSVTNLEKYGTEHTFQSEEVKAKIKEKCLEKYGVDNYYKSQEFKDKMNKLKKPCPYGCKNNHLFDKGNFSNHMIKLHAWSKEQIKEYHENKSN